MGNRKGNSAVTKVHDAAGHVVAGVRRDGTLQKTIRNSGMLTRPMAIAFDVVVLAQAAALGADRIEVVNAETHVTYQCTLADFRAHAFSINRGFGDQLALVLTRWHIVGETTTSRTPEPVRQLDLWGARG